MKSSIVVDASYAGAWLLPDEHSKEAVELLESILQEEVRLVVPEIWIYEMINLLLSANRRNRIREDQIENGILLISAVPKNYWDHRTELASSRIAKFANTYTLSAYDAAYLELADRLKAPLLSSDQRLISIAKELGLSSG